MNKALKYMLNGLSYEDALKIQKERATKILRKPVVPMTYDIRVTKGVVSGRVKPITVSEANRIHRQEWKEKIFSIFRL